VILKRISSLRASSSAAALSPADTLWLKDHVLNVGTQAGKNVTVEGALGWDAVWGAVSLITNIAKQMPLDVFQTFESTGNRKKVRTVHQAQLLGKRPNAEHYPSLWKSIAFVHLLSWGNCYLGKEFQGGRIVGLWPQPPELVRVGRENGRKVFYVKQDPLGAKELRYTSDEIIHIFGFSIDGLNGLSPLGMMREAIGAGLGMDEYLNRFYANATVLSGILSTDNDLSDDARKRVKKEWKKEHSGSRNWHKVPVLEGGLKYQPMGLPMRDAQFVEAYNLGVTKVARAYNIQPSMLAAAIAGDSFTYKNIESDALLLLKHAVAPWIVPFEDALNFDGDLMPNHLETQFDTKGAARADTKTRYDALSVAVGGRAWMKPSEARHEEGMEADDSLDELPPAVSAPGEPGGPPARPTDPPPAPADEPKK
jgi:HK97 family phage portal protein